MRIVTVGIKRTEYGFVEIEVPDNCSDEKIEALAREAESNGLGNWGDIELQFDGIIDEFKVKDENEMPQINTIEAQESHLVINIQKED